MNGPSTKQQNPPPSLLSNIDWKNLAAGTAGGAVSTLLFHPLDLLKIRWQVYENASFKLIKTNKTNSSQTSVHRPNYKSLLDTIQSIYKSENGVRGLYRGVAINTLASGSAWGLYFLIYNGLKNYHYQRNNSKELNSLNYSLYATLASLTTISLLNPLFLIKTRMCLQYGNQPNPVGSNLKSIKYKNSLDALLVLIKTDGWRGMYKGLVPGMFGTLNGTIQMVCYENMKAYWLKYLAKNSSSEDHKLNTSHFTVFSSLSKVLAVVCTYPFQLVRARLQDQHQNYKNLTDVVLKTYKNERFYGFYKGLLPGLIRMTPAASVTFIDRKSVV